jgi:hypothetical protein
MAHHDRHQDRMSMDRHKLSLYALGRIHSEWRRTYSSGGGRLTKLTEVPGSWDLAAGDRRWLNVRAGVSEGVGLHKATATCAADRSMIVSRFRVRQAA